jgi:preprotein translocase subunit SecB
MRPAKMQLKEYFVAESFFRAQPKFFEASKNEDFTLNTSDFEIEVALGERSEDSNKKICELSITLEDETEQAFPYVFRTVMLGFFELDESCAEEEAELLLKTNAPSVLYSAAREFLLLTTGRSLYMPLMLPTVTFLPAGEENAKKNIKGKTAAKQKSAKTPKKRNKNADEINLSSISDTTKQS